MGAPYTEATTRAATANPGPGGPAPENPAGDYAGAAGGDSAYAEGGEGGYDPQAMQAAGADAGAAEGARRRVLIVDDEPDFTFMMGLTLEQTGQYEVRQENDPIQALDTAREFRPDLILLDVMMPDMDGGDVLNQIRADAANKNVPVIFLTALVGGDEAPGKGMPSGGHSFLPKPVNLPNLLRRMDELLADR